MRLGERVESSRVGRIAISLVMLVLIVSVFAWNLPDGRAHDRGVRATGPITLGLGLEQDWALFAPDPRGFSVGVYATITHRDGRTERWTPPHNGLVLSPYRTYRWQKYVERLRGDDQKALWDPTARWIAREHGGSDVTRVVLTRTFQDVAEPGSGLARPPEGHFDFFTLDLR